MENQKVKIITKSNELIKGILVEPKPQLFKDTGLDKLLKSGKKFDGYWVLRLDDYVVSYVAKDEVKLITKL